MKLKMWLVTLLIGMISFAGIGNTIGPDLSQNEEDVGYSITQSIEEPGEVINLNLNYSITQTGDLSGESLGEVVRMDEKADESYHPTKAVILPDKLDDPVNDPLKELSYKLSRNARDGLIKG